MSTAIGRPQRSEAAPYYFGYIDRIKSEDVVGVFEQQLRDTSPRLDAISEEQSLARYEPGKWSIRELLGHVSDAERVFLSRAFWVARDLRMERGRQDAPLADEHGLAAPPCEHVYLRPDRGETRRANEDAEQRVVEGRCVELGLERVHLAAVGVPRDGDVEQAEARL